MGFSIAERLSFSWLADAHLGDRLTNRLRSVRIGVRLTCCFGVLGVIMLAGVLSAIWQIAFYNNQVKRLSSIDRRMISVLKVNNQVLAYRELMESTAVFRDVAKMREELVPFRAKFVTEVAEAANALKDYDSSEKTLERTIYTLLSYETAIPGQIDDILELASFDDWQSIHYRMESQMRQTSRVLANIIGEIEAGANTERKATISTMSAIQHRILGIFPMCFCLILLTSGALLGARVTGSIAEPLRELERGAQSLGSGNFRYRVRVRGRDELATVAFAFNAAAAQIEELHAGLEGLVAERTADLRQANESLKRLSSQDALTGIANRRTFDEALNGGMMQALETHSAISLLMVDVDHFKGLNDLYGHQKGDECLIQVVKALESVSLRNGDSLSRYGGEEFAVILHDTDSEGAKGVAERMRAAVAGLGIPNRGSPVLESVSISIGAATIRPSQITPPEALVRKADQALYKAKQNGRNRVWQAELSTSAEV